MMNGIILLFAMLATFFLGVATGSNLALGACSNAGEQGYTSIISLYEGRVYCEHKKNEQ